jgi:hypothetical protein
MVAQMLLVNELSSMRPERQKMAGPFSGRQYLNDLGFGISVGTNGWPGLGVSTDRPSVTIGSFLQKLTFRP